MLPDCMYDYRYEREGADDTIVECCQQCGEDILVDDEYWDIEGKIFCSVCIEDCRHVA